MPLLKFKFAPKYQSTIKLHSYIIAHLHQSMIPPNNPAQEHNFSIKCECNIFRDSLLISNHVKKSKFSNLILQPKTKTLRIVPLLTKDIDYSYELKKLKNIHKKCIGQGKITIEFNDTPNKINDGGNLQSGQKKQKLIQILIQSASPENLELLISKIINLKMSLKNHQTKPQSKPKIDRENDSKTEDQNPNADPRKKKDFPKLEKYRQAQEQRKRDPLKYNQSIKNFESELNNRLPKPSRKELMRQAYENEPEQIIVQKVPQKKPIFRPQNQFLDLPYDIKQKIFQYAGNLLRHRLISKKLQLFILQNIKGLNFLDEVDQPTFNTLAKYVPNIRGRLKNVRSIDLIDLYDKPELQKNMAKSLYFGDWKEMSRKNIKQIKTLRIHTLEMPYQIKFDFQQIYGIRLRQLHLVSKSDVTAQNIMITDQKILHLLKTVKELEALSIPYINSSVLDELTTNLKEKTLQMRELRIGSLNENCKKQENWFLFHAYENLRCLKVERVLKGGMIRKGCAYTFTFPLYINSLEIGSIVSEETVRKLPTTLLYLKLQGDQYYNNDISNIVLPYLRCFDISECPMVRPSVINDLQRCNKLRLITNWDKQDFDYWKKMAHEKDIEVISIKGMIRR